MTEQEKPFTYAWKAHPNSFQNWMLTVLIAGLPESEFQELAKATKKWQEVTLTIQVNGIPVPTKSFIEGVERNMRWWAEKEAHRMMTENVRFEELSELISAAEREAVALVRKRLAAAGIELPYEED